MDEESYPVNNNKKEKYENNGKKILFKQKIKQFLLHNIFIILFSVMFCIDYSLELFVFSKIFQLSIEKRAYKFFSTLFFIIVVIIYITLLIKSPAQTNIELVMEKEKYRIIPDYLLDSYPKFCEYCDNKRKFERSSHCRICNCCILRRDHHCNFINKCVGYNNNKLFFIYLIYQMIFAFIFFRGFITYYNSDPTNEKFETLICFFSFISALITLLLFFWVFSLFSKLIYSYLTDLTFYEQYLNPNMYEELNASEKENENKERNIYDKGWIANLVNVLGPTLLHFILPLPFQVKCQFPEETKTFESCINISPGELTRELSGTVYDTLDNIVKSQIDSANPSRFMDNARKCYDLPNVKII